MNHNRSAGTPYAAQISLPKNVAGLVNGLHWALVFVQWSASLRQPPTVQQICDRFGVSRATGYRYKSAWEAAVAQRLVEPPASLRAAYSNLQGEHHEIHG